MNVQIESLNNGLIVSCQPVPGGAMDDDVYVVGFALAALSAGARGVRIESARYVAAVRQATAAPIIGLVKRDLTDSPVRITPFVDDVFALAQAGADIIAFDATDRVRPANVEALAQAVRDAGKLSMADCSSVDDARRALAAGVDYVGSTMSGYTGGPEPTEPDIELVGRLRALTPNVIAEGRIRTPEQAQAAAKAGAACVVVGSAITRTEHVTDWFARALDAVYAPVPVVLPMVLGVDLGGTKIRASLVQAGAVLDTVVFATDRSGQPDGWLRAISNATALWRGRYARVGMAVTGAVRNGAWRAMNTATLGLEGDFPLQAQAEAIFGVPVTIANDAQAAAWGEFRASADPSDLIFLTLSTGLGGGIVAQGRLMQGLAGHFGQMRVGDEPLETTLCGPWIAAEAHRLGHACQPKDVFDAAIAGEDWAMGIIDAVSARFARLCCDIQVMLDPARIVIGGGVGLADGFIERVQQHIARLCPAAAPQLRAARLGHEAGIIGIADLAQSDRIAL